MKLPAIPANERHHPGRPDPTSLANEYVTNSQHTIAQFLYRVANPFWNGCESVQLPGIQQIRAVWRNLVLKLGNDRQLVASHVAPRWDVHVAPNDETTINHHNGQLTVAPWCTPSVTNGPSRPGETTSHRNSIGSSSHQYEDRLTVAP